MTNVHITSEALFLVDEKYVCLLKKLQPGKKCLVSYCTHVTSYLGDILEILLPVEAAFPTIKKGAVIAMTFGVPSATVKRSFLTIIESN